MANESNVLVPDIGDFEEVDVIDILVAAGDKVGMEDPLVTLESDKATMDIPAPFAGVVQSVAVNLGDKVSEGSVLVVLSADDKTEAAKSENNDNDHEENVDVDKASADSAPSSVMSDGFSSEKTPQTPAAEATPPPTEKSSAAGKLIEVVIPDIGDFEDVDVIDIIASTGARVEADDPLITLESDKATMDIPAPVAGELTRINVSIGDKVSEGYVFAIIKSSGEQQPSGSRSPAKPTDLSHDAANEPTEPTPKPEPSARPEPTAGKSRVYASPSVRKFARELGVDLTNVTGSGRKHRILKADVKAFVKDNIGRTGGLNIPPGPEIDFSKYGEIETVELSKIRRLTGENLHRSWITVPHVTQFDEADITELETFRKSQRDDAAENGAKLTLLTFLMKACVTVLQKYPDFNASLASDGQNLIRKKYFHIGMAVNTDAGLVVPVIKDVEQKSLYAIAKEISELATKTRDRKLAPAEMQGACFTISNLGGIAGTAFTPIVNPPEVAILGVSPATMKPIYINGEFEPRLMLPLSLSYDHRVIDGVAGAMFTRELSSVLNDIRRILL